MYPKKMQYTYQLNFGSMVRLNRFESDPENVENDILPLIEEDIKKSTPRLQRRYPTHTRPTSTQDETKIEGFEIVRIQSFFGHERTSDTIALLSVYTFDKDADEMRFFEVVRKKQA